jgi:hypothetical protein
MAFDIKLYEYAFGNDYEDGDSHKSINSGIGFDVKVLNYELTPLNPIENYTFKVPNNNGLLWKGMSFGSGEIKVDYLIYGTSYAIERKVSDFINNYLGYYNQQNRYNKFTKKLVLVNTNDYSNRGHLVVLSDVSTTKISDYEAIISATFIKLQPHMISRTMYTNSNVYDSLDVITLNTSYLTNIDTFPFITLVFNASCTNPVLTLNDNSYMRIVEDFSINDTIIINCEDKTLTINGSNGLYALDYSSTFFGVNDLNNTIEFVTSSGGAGTAIGVNWYNRTVL